MAAEHKDKNAWKLYSSLGYAIVMIAVGIPVWWKTTTVHRAELPYGQISGLSTSNAALAVNILLVSRDAQSDHILGPKIQSRLKDSSIYEYQLSSRTHSSAELEAVRKAETLEELDTLTAELQANVIIGTVILFEVPKTSGIVFKDGIKMVLGTHRTLFFAQSPNKIEYDNLVKDLVMVAREKMLGERAVKNVAAAIAAPNSELNTKWNLRRITAAPSYDLLFSLLVPEPERLTSKWKIQQAIEAQFQPLFDDLKEVVTFNVKSQVLYLTALSVEPKQRVIRESEVAFVVSEDDLSLSITMESQLASHTSSAPTIQFLAYIPPRAQSPMYISSAESEKISDLNAFLVHRWGGVAIHNSNNGEIDTEHLLCIFSTQLRLLLGILDGSDSTIEKSDFNFLHTLETPLTRLKTWEKEFLMRVFYVENIYSTKVTLQSLSHLLSTISNIVIREDIGDEIHRSVEDFLDASKKARTGQLQDAFHLSQSSKASAEKAFFDHTLLALLYFPEDQKYAIYIPLFLPIAFSLATSLWPVYKKLTGKGKQSEPLKAKTD